ncbi:thioredoxin domain-containing protein [Candidatus Paracaedibacter symbiosus]|uniref:thioredoxin domain-containing protein n=1 Tax=Candidatus Paracaedibacter symbiosus TaxID=244582 RepID=UPI000509AD8E|nr:thioredoxin domain-containing protein [Candidatus Paracaedibacter symbiosus]
MLKTLGLFAMLGTAAMAAKTTEDAKAGTAIAGLAAGQKEELNKAIGEYIKNNPKVVVESLQAFTEQQQKEALKKVQDSITSSKDQLSDSKNAIVMGKADAAVKLVLFVDPNCPHCRLFELALGDIEKELPGKDKLGILVRQWPILGQNSEIVSAGLVAASTQDPAKFTVLSEKVLKSEKSMDNALFMSLAKEAGYDVTKLEAATKSEAVQNQLKNTKELAGKIGLEATPTVILSDKNGARLVQVGDKEGLKKLLVDAIKAS